MTLKPHCGEGSKCLVNYKKTCLFKVENARVKLVSNRNKTQWTNLFTCWAAT